TAKPRDTEEEECFSRNYFFDELASPFFISAGLLNYQCDEAIKTYLEFEAIGGEMVEDTFPDMRYSYYRFLKTYEISR
ncbi:MAG: hypothetical protein HRU21_11370, partial [Pseudomonadales bacterium]|nr:hypothetical protein [Pseudomonadales bacterium]